MQKYNKDSFWKEKGLVLIYKRYHILIERNRKIKSCQKRKNVKRRNLKQKM